MVPIKTPVFADEKVSVLRRRLLCDEINFSLLNEPMEGLFGDSSRKFEDV